MIEKMRLGPCTVTVPPSKICTSGTKSQPLWISLIKDNPLAGVLRERAVTDDVSQIVTEGALSVQTDTGEVTKASAKRTVVARAMVLGGGLERVDSSEGIRILDSQHKNAPGHDTENKQLPQSRRVAGPTWDHEAQLK